MKLKRLVSAVLAVGMALTMLPTAAFADNTSVNTQYVTDLEFDANNEPKGYSDIPAQPGGNWRTHTSGKGWSWSYQITTKDGKEVKSSNRLRIDKNYTYDPMNGSVPETLSCTVFSDGDIANGSFLGDVYPSGNVTGGNFASLNARGGTIDGDVVIGKYTSNSNGGGTFKKGIVWGTMSTITLGQIEGGIFAQKPVVNGSATITSTPRALTAPNCVVCDYIELNESKPSAYVVGAQTVTVRTPAKKFKEWKVDGLTVTPDMQGEVTIDGTKWETLTFTMPDNDVEIQAVKVSTPLTIKDGLPVDEDGPWFGDAKNDGWTYNGGVDTEEVNKRFKTEENFTADLKGNTVKWSVTNNGTLENGTIDNTITNYGTVKGITATWYFNNYGTIESGVFSRMANFGEQNPSVRWVSVNGGTVNGMSVAGIVGKQTVTVKADTGFKCWSVSGDTDFALTEEQKYNPELALTLNGEDKGNIILTAQTEEGYYRLNLTDGKAYSATADGAKDQEINAAKPGDTVILEADASLIPDGMVFDRWEVTGDTELTGNFDAKAEKTSFTMPKSEVTLRAMYRMADQPEEPNVLGTVAMVATAGVGAAVVGYTGYMIGTELYLNTVLPEGTAIPNNTTELAKLLWTDAGKPAPAAVLAADATDEQKALTWAVENQLISADKAADASVGRWEVIDAWNKAQEMKKA